MDSIDESYKDDNSDGEYISTDYPEEIWDGEYVHPSIKARVARLIICSQIRQAQSEWKGA